MDPIVWLMLAVGAIFLVYLLYTGQFKWLVSIIRNIVLGIMGILGLNTLLAGVGIAVGVNAITALIIGLLGVPGFLLLYAAQVLVG